MLVYRRVFHIGRPNRLMSERPIHQLRLFILGHDYMVGTYARGSNPMSRDRLLKKTHMAYKSLQPVGVEPKFHGCFEVPKLVLWPRTFNNGCFREGTHLSGQLQREAGKSIQKSMKKTSWASMSKNPATPVTLALSSHSCTDFLSLHAAWTACAAQEASSSLAAKNGIWLDHWGVLSKETYRKPTGNHDFSHERCKLCKFSHLVWKG